VTALSFLGLSPWLRAQAIIDVVWRDRARIVPRPRFFAGPDLRRGAVMRPRPAEPAWHDLFA